MSFDIDKIFDKIKKEFGKCDKCGVETEFYNPKEKLYLCKEHQPMGASVEVNWHMRVVEPIDRINIVINPWEKVLREKGKKKSNRKSKVRDKKKMVLAKKRKKDKRAQR